MNLLEPLTEELAKYAPHVDKQRREDWLVEAIQIESYNADMTRSFNSPEQRQDYIKSLTEKAIRRLSSFGGNDIAAFWMDELDIFSPFTTEEGLPQNTQAVIESKLCVVAPNRMTGDMIRGVALEPMAQLDFERKMAANGWISRPDMLEIFSNLYENRIPEHPWLVGMPDGIYEDKKGRVYVVDFKCPANPDTVKLMQRDPPEGYNAQMGTYEAILNFHGIQVKDRILAPLSLKTMETTSIVMPEVKNFTSQLLELGDTAWSHVLNGTIPSRKFGVANVENIQEVNPRVEHSANSYAYYKALENRASKMAATAKSELEWDLQKYHGINPSDHGKIKLPVGISYSTTQPKDDLNKEALLREIVKLGGDKDNPDLYVKRSPTTRLIISTSKKSPYAPRLDQLRTVASEMLEEAEEELLAVIGELPERPYVSSPDTAPESEPKTDKAEGMSP